MADLDLDAIERDARSDLATGVDMIGAKIQLALVAVADLFTFTP